MEIEFEKVELCSIYEGGKIPKGYQPSVIKAFIKTINVLRAFNKIEDLYRMNSLRFEALRGNKEGLFSVRVNDQYRLEFKHREDGTITIITIHELSNHYR